MSTDPDADDRETLDRASKHVTRYLDGLDECRTRVEMLEDQIEAQRSETMTRSSLNLTAAFKQGKGEPSRHFDRLPATAGGRQVNSEGTEVDRRRTVSAGKIAGVHVVALLLALVLFYFHVVVIFDVIGEMLRGKAWLLAHLGPQHSGKILLLGCFLALVLAHLAEAAVWGLVLRLLRLVSSITEGIYFTAASITTLGYGDVLLKYPWRHLGTLIAVTGVLTFGCSTAFLFVVLQDVWVGHL